MIKHNANNERIKRDYFVFLKEARQQSEASVDAVAKAIARFESHTRCRDFRQFHIEQAMAFKRQLVEQDSVATGQKLSRSTVHATLRHLVQFFEWLAGQPGYRSRFSFSDAAYFNASGADARVAKAARERPVPTLEQIRHVLTAMPTGTDIELRNRALIALTLLTGARDGAVASFKLKHIRLERSCVNQDAREVRTKNSKTFVSAFFPVGDDVRQIVVDWVNHLRTNLLWGPNDPLFPATAVVLSADHQFVPAGLKREHWSNASPIRTIFREAFAAVGLPYFNPHSFRKTLAQLGESLCRSPEEFKAWSQNLGHEGVLTTLISYGTVPVRRQVELMQGLGSAPSANARKLAEQVMALAQAAVAGRGER